MFQLVLMILFIYVPYKILFYVVLPFSSEKWFKIPNILNFYFKFCFDKVFSVDSVWNFYAWVFQTDLT